MTDYVLRIYGHPEQIAPTHIVITSPYFSTREVRGTTGIAHGQFMGKYMHKADAPIETIRKMRAEGRSYNSISVTLGLPPSSVRTWCLGESER